MRSLHDTTFILPALDDEYRLWWSGHHLVAMILIGQRVMPGAVRP